MRKVKMGLIGFVILLVGIMQPESIAKAEKPLESQMEPSADSSDSSDSVISISETINGVLRTGVSLPDAVHDNAFVEKLVLPKGIDTFLGEDYYEYDEALIQNYSSMTPNCPNLKWIEVDKDNKSLMSRDGILYSKDGTRLYYCPPGKSGEITVPEGVTTIDFQAFQDCTKITKINLPSTLKMIHIAAFGGNTGLLEITVPSNNEAFKVIDHALFTKDGKVLYAYAGGREEAVYTLPENVRIISDAVFKNCTNLKEFYANENLSLIKVEAFKNCTNLKTVQLKKGLQVICAGAFMNCSSLTKLDLPEGLTDLFEKAIFGCTNLLDISLPESFQNIDYGAIDDVEGRVIRVYNPFYFAGLNSYERAKNVTVYAYRGSYTAAQLKKNGLKAAYFEEEYCNLPKQSKAPASAVKGNGKADTSWYDGKKYEYKISTPDQLAGLGVLVRKGIDFAGKSVMLMNDLDLGCYSSWSPIGYSRNGAEYSFRGTFYGEGHTVYHMKFKTYTNSDLGLFGINEGDISYLNIEDSQIFGRDNIGLLAGTNRGRITDCNVSGYVRGQENVGGLVGKNQGRISSCLVTAEIYGIHSVGGVTGINYMMLSHNIAKGTIFGYNEVGGIVGYNNGGVSDYAYVTAAKSEMKVNGYDAVGGIAGSCYFTYILDCANYGAVNGNENVGGVVGGDGFDVNIINCKNQGGITGSYSVGGISGYMSLGMITYCENAGDVSGFSEIGGILGTLGSVYPDYDRVLISESSRIPTGRYSVGEVIGQNLQVNYDK
jgi:hypothetical protein